MVLYMNFSIFYYDKKMLKNISNSKNMNKMKIISILLILILLFSLFTCKRHSQLNKYDKEYRRCANTQECLNRKYDESCVYKCVSIDCYDNLLSNYIFEFGENSYSLKTQFESCFSKK